MIDIWHSNCGKFNVSRHWQPPKHQHLRSFFSVLLLFSKGEFSKPYSLLYIFPGALYFILYNNSATIRLMKMGSFQSGIERRRIIWHKRFLIIVITIVIVKANYSIFRPTSIRQQLKFVQKVCRQSPSKYGRRHCICK